LGAGPHARIAAVRDRRPDAILFDAYGTLVELDEPVGRLRSALAGMGCAYSEVEVAAAFSTEVRFYRAHHDRGRDDRGLRILRRACAGVFAGALPVPPPVEVAEASLAAGLRYRVFADVEPALDALASAGFRLAVASNWDASLPAILDEVGLGARFAAVSVSAVAGARKPDAAVFHRALDRLGAAPGDAIHVGDDPVNDCVGAANAGLRAVLLDRQAKAPDVPCTRIVTLMALPGVR
jgi:HAD superfamily hydrolase (TIGR01509 family)